MKRLQGKAALITGAAPGGIGAATARRFCEEGARVVLADFNVAGAETVAAALSKEGFDIVALPLDLGDEQSIKAVIQQTLDRLQGLDVLFNNAADTRPEILSRDAAIEQMDPDVWDQTFKVNARGTMLMIKHCLPALMAKGNGAIINTSSGASLLGDLYRPAYASSKSAINVLTKYVASQYGKKGIRCNVVSPGMVITEAAKEMQAANFAMYERHHLTPYLGAPEDIAAMVALLASDDGRFVNGQVIAVDGGISCHFAHVADNRDDFDAFVQMQSELQG